MIIIIMRFQICKVSGTLKERSVYSRKTSF